MTSISKNICIDKLADIVNEDNSTYHGTTKMKPANVKSSTYSDFSIENNDKDFKSEVGNHVGLTGVIKQFKNTGTFYKNEFSDICCYRYYFGRYSSKLAQLAPLPYSQVRSTCYCDSVNDFSFVIPKLYKDVYVNSFFPRTTRLWNYLPIECLKSRINRHLLTVGSF